jgi:DNA-directed RNA polymerase subunit RPC12/RpoP
MINPFGSLGQPPPPINPAQAAALFQHNNQLRAALAAQQLKLQSQLGQPSPCSHGPATHAQGCCPPPSNTLNKQPGGGCCPPQPPVTPQQQQSQSQQQPIPPPSPAPTTASGAAASNVRALVQDKPYVCDYCGRGYSYLASLQQHMKTHQVEYQFQCNGCSRLFKTGPELEEHKKSHETDGSETRPHQCEQCGRRFTLLENLHRHQMIHSDQRPFHCAFCGKRFRRQCL